MYVAIHVRYGVWQVDRAGCRERGSLQREGRL